jgi:NhaA family Na+:H+ antiporter
MRDQPVDVVSRVAEELRNGDAASAHDENRLARPLQQLRLAQREILPPVVRVQAALHPWVAFGIMPLFALANAGVSVGGVNLATRDAQLVMAGVAAALRGG